MSSPTWKQTKQFPPRYELLDAENSVLATIDGAVHSQFFWHSADVYGVCFRLEEAKRDAEAARRTSESGIKAADPTNK